jgi:hypothetical protein
VQLYQDLSQDAYLQGEAGALVRFWCCVFVDTFRSVDIEYAAWVNRSHRMGLQNRPWLLFVVVASLPVLLLQMWDSDVFASSGGIITLVLLAIGIPVVAALLTLEDKGLVVAGASSLLLLFLARFTSPTPLDSDLFTILPLLGLILYFSRVTRLKLTA